MALEPAGISLEAKGFQEYIRRLDAIEKKNRQVFDTDFKGTQKSYNQVVRAAKQYEAELKQVAKAEKEARRNAKELAAAQKTAAATTRQAFISTGQAIFNVTKQIAQAAFELGKLGAQFQGSQIGLKNLAANFGQSGRDIQKAIKDASRGTLSGLDAIQAANQGLLLGVAQTPEQFAELTSTAITLGRTLGLEATQSIEQFTSALGRQSLLILDNFGVSAKQVNAEIERLAQADFGKARSELTEAQKQATFMKAALNIAATSAATIGDEAGEAQAAFDRLTASSKDFKTELGIALSDLNKSLGITEKLTAEINQASEAIRTLRGGAKDATLDEQIDATEIKIRNLQDTLKATQEGLREGGGLFGTGLFEGFFAAQDEAAIDKQLETLVELEGQLGRLKFQKAAEDAKDFNSELADIPPVIEDSTDAIEDYSASLQQAESLQLSFARAAEDSARKLARANEDIARKQAQQVGKLQERQAKDRDKLLQDQAKRLDEFEKDRRKQIARAEGDIKKARREAGEQRKRDQQKLQRELARAQARFNLNSLQSERRFKLQESRLRAEGDILALKELREDFGLQQQEEKENFDISKREQIDSAKATQREQTKDLDKKLKELKTNLEEQRADLLTSFDEQLRDQQQAQIDARAEQQRAFQEAAAERAIQLAREEEDRRISQQRQLEDLGRSLAEQQGVTAEGALAIAGELEKVFGTEGVADKIIEGFTDKAESEFKDLFDNLADIADSASIPAPTPIRQPRLQGVGRIGGIPEFQEGGIVPGAIGSPQIIQAHGGETVLPVSQQMMAPVIGNQNLSVNMSGGFNISGGESAGEAAVQAALVEMTENFRIAVTRLARRN